MSISGFTPLQMRVLVLLTLINFVNYVDRQVIFPLFSLIKAEFLLSDFQVGFIGTVFSLVHSPATIILAYVADRTSRKAIITYGILFWSGATFLTGLAQSYRQLLAARALVGVGEGAYTPAGTAIISATFPKEVRARVQGLFNLGMFLGGAVGIALGGILGEMVGWRPAFFIVGLPGLVLALSVIRLPEPPRASREERMYVPMRRLLRVPAYVMILVSGWFITLAGASYVTWGTEFVHRYKGFSLTGAGISLGAIVVVGGILGVIFGAWLADRLQRRFIWGRVLAISLGFLLGSPVVLAALYTTSQALFLGLFFLGTFFMSFYHGPLTAIIHDMTPEPAHATAIGGYYFFVNLFATTLAPVVIGDLADRYDLFRAMHGPVVFHLIGALLFLSVIYFIRRDGLRHRALEPYWSASPVV